MWQRLSVHSTCHWEKLHPQIDFILGEFCCNTPGGWTQLTPLQSVTGGMWLFTSQVLRLDEIRAQLEQHIDGLEADLAHVGMLFVQVMIDLNFH